MMNGHQSLQTFCPPLPILGPGKVQKNKSHLNHSSSVQFSRSVMSNSLQPHGQQHARLPCPSPSSGACSNSCPLNQGCHPTISSSVFPFSSCFQPSPASGFFPMSQFFAVTYITEQSSLCYTICHWLLSI